MPEPLPSGMGDPVLSISETRGHTCTSDFNAYIPFGLRHLYSQLAVENNFYRAGFTPSRFYNPT